MTNEIQLPRDPEMERVVLGVLLLSESAEQIREAELTADCFMAFNREIYQALLDLAGRGEESINPVVLQSHLAEKGSKVEPSDIAALYEGVPRFSNSAMATEFQTLRDLATRRAILRDMGQWHMEAQRRDVDVDALVGRIQSAAAGFGAASAKDSDMLVWASADQVEEREIDWLCYPYIPRGYLTGIVGEEGVGKSYLACSLAACASTGKFFNGEVCTPVNVMMLSAEDDYRAVTVPRLRRLGADLSKIKITEQVFTLDTKGLLMLSHDIERFAPGLVIIDPIFAYTQGDTNTSKDSRSVLGRIQEMARIHNSGILPVRHIGKGKGGGDPRAAGLGSIEWRTVVRSELLIGKDPDDPSSRSMVHTKHNYSLPGRTWGYTIKPAVDEHGVSLRNDVGYFKWTGESALTAERILSQIGAADEVEAKIEAEDFLRQFLKDGEQTAEEVNQAATRLRLTDHAMRRARAALGIKPQKRGFGKEQFWVWALPSPDGNSNQADDPPETLTETLKPEISTSQLSPSEETVSGDNFAETLRCGDTPDFNVSGERAPETLICTPPSTSQRLSKNSRRKSAPINNLAETLTETLINVSVPQKAAAARGSVAVLTGDAKAAKAVSNDATPKPGKRRRISI